MKAIPVVSLKGGVGKSTIAAGLAKALHSAGFSVGALDADYHAPNLPLVLGCEGKPRRGKGDVILPPQVDGIKVLSWAMLWPEDTAVTVEDVQINTDDLLPIIDTLESGCIEGERLQGSAIISRIGNEEVVVLQRSVFNATLKVLRRLAEHPGGAVEHIASLMQPGIIDWGDLDFLVIDTPPESTGIVRVVAESANVSGVVIVSHASTVSRADVRRTVDLFRKTATPVYGLVINQMGEHDLTETDMRDFAALMEIPVVAVIPHIRPPALFNNSYFDSLAKFVLSAQPTILKPVEVGEDKSALKAARKFLELLEALKQ